MKPASTEDLRRFVGKVLAAERSGEFRNRAFVGGMERLAETVGTWTSGDPALSEALPERFRGVLTLYARSSRRDRRELLARLENALDGGGPAALDGIATARKPAPSSPEPTGTADDPVTVLRGVSERRAELLARLGVRRLRDLAWLLPARYEDRSVRTEIASAAPGATVTLRARVAEARVVKGRFRRGRLEARLEDATGGIDAIWFNQPWMSEVVRPGMVAIFHGPVRARAEGLQMANPELDFEGKARAIVPVYPCTDGLFQKSLRWMVSEALAVALREYEETLPAEMVGRLELPPPARSLREAHEPSGARELERALGRLRFEELFYLQLAIAVKRHLFLDGQAGVVVAGHSGMIARLRERLPFCLTAAQERALGDILADLRAPRPMARLLQGDVGAGKTVVALAAMAAAAGEGFQAALMAPTEILAGQHYLGIRRLCEDLGIGVELLVGGQAAPARRSALEAIRSGASAIAVGTHALLEGSVEFRGLGLVVIDEQHRFGVSQRARLKLKGDSPNLLVMTATPIPRTLALTLYGDLDVSVLDELPPGRQPIRTRALTMEHAGTAYAHIRQEVSAGRQAYVVCPLVEESETLEAEAAEATFEEVRTKWLPGARTLLLHGRMPGAEKARVMEAMRAGDADVLVATTVVEVGVDLPNATVMAVLNAERFGLAQLHQLRGRIGRGAHPSFFYPMTGKRTPSVSRRMKVLARSSDGFAVAEEDLAIRGPGELFGTRQSGLQVLRAAELPRDLALLEQARREARRLVETDPDLTREDVAATRRELMRRYGEFVNRRH